MALNKPPLPGNAFQSVHFDFPATAEDAWIASYSSSLRTATRFPLTTSCDFGNCFLSSVPAEISVDPSVGGFTTRACNMPGSLMSAVHVAAPETMSGIVFIGWDLPITLYWLTGLVGGLPTTVSVEASAVPVVGIVRFSCWP